MTPSVELHPTKCAICGTFDGARELYAANFDPQAFNPTIFSARRLPDRIHYRMVKCQKCDLVRSDPVIDSATLDSLYAQSSFDYGAEVASLQRTYGRALKHLEKHGVIKGNLLEIGCGNGFFLEEAKRQGYQNVRGVEPSSQAIEKAAPEVREQIVCDMMRPGLFSDPFDVICLFQVFDHIPEPGPLLDACLEILKPGGLILFLNHNIEAVSARVLQERSPIIDIEHTYLYSAQTLGKLAALHGLQTLESRAVFNTYPLSYLTRLVPLPKAVKIGLLRVLARTRLGRLTLPVPLGNLCLIARKRPETH